jgi:hypothetical protein
VSYTFDGDKFSVELVEGMLFGELRRLLSGRHGGADVIWRPPKADDELVSIQDYCPEWELQVRTMIFVKEGDGTTYSFFMSNKTPIFRLVAAIQSKIGRSGFSLIFKGERLREDRTLPDYNIVSGDTVEILFQQRGC